MLCASLALPISIRITLPIVFHAPAEHIQSWPRRGAGGARSARRTSTRTPTDRDAFFVQPERKRTIRFLSDHNPAGRALAITSRLVGRLAGLARLETTATGKVLPLARGARRTRTRPGVMIARIALQGLILLMSDHPSLHAANANTSFCEVYVRTACISLFAIFDELTLAA